MDIILYNGRVGRSCNTPFVATNLSVASNTFIWIWRYRRDERPHDAPLATRNLGRDSRQDQARWLPRDKQPWSARAFIRLVVCVSVPGAIRRNAGVHRRQASAS